MDQIYCWKPMAAAAALYLLAGAAIAAADDAHPTLQEFKDEIRRADVVLRGRVREIVQEQPSSDGAVQTLRLRVDKLYKGPSQGPKITLMLGFWGVEKCQVGTELILPIQLMRPHSDDPAPLGQSVIYGTRFIYRVHQGQVTSDTGMADDLQPYKELDRMEALIERVAAGQEKKPRRRAGRGYVPAEVLFSDDFNDGSWAGWTLLQGTRSDAGMKGHPGPVDFPQNPYEIWVGEGTTWKNEYGPDAGTEGRLVRDPATGNLEGRRNGSAVQIGVYDGRLRLRSSHLHQHMTIVAGDPNWTDYQVDVDVYDRKDKGIDEPRLITEVDYKKLGLFGRMTVPNLPKTRGEHTELAVELGLYANEGAVTEIIGRDCFQIRMKGPDVDFPRWGSVDTRRTKLLDYDTWPIKHNVPIHLTAKYMGNRVEGWIDGKKYLEGLIPESNWPEFQRGRIGLWVFSTFAEFDNVKVTRLVKRSERE